MCTLKIAWYVDLRFVFKAYWTVFVVQCVVKTHTFWNMLYISVERAEAEVEMEAGRVCGG